MSTLKLGFDLDGVLYPWTEAIFEHLQLYDLLPKELTYYDFWKHYSKDYKNQLWWDNIARIEPIYGVRMLSREQVSVMWELSYRYEICYITARPPLVRLTTEKWLRSNKLPNYENLTMCSRLMDKYPVIRAKSIDIYVEDRVELIDKLKNCCKVFMSNQVYNKDYNDPKVTRFYQIKDLLNYL